MYCLNFSKRKDEPQAEPSGHFRTNVEEHYVDVLKDDFRRPRITGNGTLSKKASLLQNGCPVESLSVASSVVLSEQTYGQDVDNRNSPVNRFEKEFDIQSTTYLSRRDAPDERESSVLLNRRESSVLGMELQISPNESLYTEQCKDDKRPRKILYHDKRKNQEKYAHQLAKELATTMKLLQCERSQRKALVERLDHMDRQLQQLKKPQSQEFSVTVCKEQIDDLNTKLKIYIADLKEEREKNRNLEENMRILKSPKSNQKHSAELKKQYAKNKILKQEIRVLKATEAENNQNKSKLEKERAQNEKFREEIELIKAQDSTQQYSALLKEQRAKNWELQHQLQVIKAQSGNQEGSVELEEQCRENKKLREDIKNMKTENSNLNHQMRLLMFQHIPLASPKLKDIGSVDYDIKETQIQVRDYQLGKKLGEGHFGTVQQGININTKKKCAIKILDKQRMKRFKDLQQIAMEAHVLKNYSHPNIVHLEGVIHAAENIYLILELCSMDLHTFLNTVGLPEESAKQTIFGILKALEHLHENGICHLDLKPENILITKTSDPNSLHHKHIRISDFGLVSMTKEPDISGAIVRKGYACGTPGFFAPEMMIKKEFEGRTADMWSLGAIILEITLGFTHEWIESYQKVNSDLKAFRAGLQNCLDEIPRERYPLHQNMLDIIHSCLSLDPSSRITASQAINHSWLGSVSGIVSTQQQIQDTAVCCELIQPEFPDLL